jgi:hypothetical protein
MQNAGMPGRAGARIRGRERPGLGCGSPRGTAMTGRELPLYSGPGGNRPKRRGDGIAVRCPLRGNFGHGRRAAASPGGARPRIVPGAGP